MTRNVRLPTPRGSLADHEQRISDLELLLRRKDRPSKFDEWITFNLTGPVAAADESDDYTPVTQGHLFYIFNTLKTVGSTQTVISVRKNGAEVASYTIPASAKRHQASLDLSFSLSADYLTLAISTAGTGAAGLVSTVRFN